MPFENQLSVFLTMLLVYIFVSKGLKGRSGLAVDLVLVICSIVICAYRIINHDALIFERAGLATRSDVFAGVVAVILVLEAVRRTQGRVLVVLGLVFVVYNFAGPYLPGLLGHRGYSLGRVVSQLYLTEQGIYGLPVKVLLQYVALFVAFGSLLEATGGSQFLIDLARALAGHVTGGLAKVAVVASGTMGMVSGSAVANVATTGCITIPAMKKGGYEPHIAGAVEAVASTGGQIMPPVMGAVAFIMADFLQIRYLEVCKAAVIPAIFYYFATFMAVHFYALARGLKGEPKDALPSIWAVLRQKGYFIIPILLLVHLLVRGYSPTIAGIAAFGSVIAVGLIFPKGRERLGFGLFFEALSNAGGSLGNLVAISATAGIVVGTINLTGLGPRLSGILVELSGGNMLLLLGLTAITSLILGMGMPTAVAYLVLATLVAPALTMMGAQQIVAHLFILYFGILSMITPPVALAAYTGAALAGSEPNRTGWTAVRLSLPSFLIPFAFVLAPELALQGSFLETLRPILTTSLGTILLAGATMGYFFRGQLKTAERALLASGAILLIDPSLMTDLVGLLLAGLGVIMHLRFCRRTYDNPVR